MKKILLTLLVGFCSIQSWAEFKLTNYVITAEADNNEYKIKVNTVGANDEKSALELNSTYIIENKKFGGFDISGQNGRLSEIGNGSSSIATSDGSSVISISIDATYLEIIRTGAFANFTNTTSFTISNGQTPATLGANAFPTEWKTSCNLLVPENAKDAYKSAWGAYFKTVNGETIEDDGEGNGEGNEGENTPTGIKENNAKSLNIHAVAHKIVLNRVENIQVFSITGAIIYKGNTNEVEVDNAGIYIVKTPSSTHKILVKE